MIVFFSLLAHDTDLFGGTDVSAYILFGPLSHDDTLSNGLLPCFSLSVLYCTFLIASLIVLPANGSRTERKFHLV